MNIEVGQHRIVARSNQPLVHFMNTLDYRLEGRKQWVTPHELHCERSEHNLRVLTEIVPGARVDRQHDFTGIVQTTHAEPEFVLEPRKFQLENYERFKNKLQFAIFSEQGTGKTKVALDIISYRFKAGIVSGVIVLSSPKGVHAQWIDEQLPKHLWPSVPVQTYIWDGGKPPDWVHKSSDKLQIISGNIDMLRGKGFNVLNAFAARHGNNCLILVDESDSIKDIRAKRSIKLRDLSRHTKQRVIMTGTPIAKDLTDEWAQFYFLNPDIIGHKYLTSFRAQYCIMGGYENHSVVGHKNISGFKELTAPHIFRATKAELDLPPKLYDSVQFELSDEQRRLIKGIRDSFYALVEERKAVSVNNGAVALLRVQEISNGFVTIENGGGIRHLESNPRLDALLDLRRQILGPTIIWCRFREDVRVVHKALPNSAVIWGEENSLTLRSAAKEAFVSGRVQNLIATPGAAGRGVDGLQDVCTDAIYYSNSYNSLDRWQSEDRIHRIGMKGTARYFDLIGRGSTDRAILRNLQGKKGLSEWVLDDIVKILGTIE